MSFVTFNYDRSLEHFLWLALQHHSGFTPSEAGQLLSKHLSVEHAFGDLGPLPSITGSGFEYGPSTDPSWLAPMSRSIQTFSEQIDSGRASRIKKAVAGAERLIFLGCAHHSRNMDLLRPDDPSFTEVFATYNQPAPPDEHSQPSIEDFSSPGRIEFSREVYRWQKPGRSDGRHIQRDKMHIEALTNLQLITRWGSSWTE